MSKKIVRQDPKINFLNFQRLMQNLIQKSYKIQNKIPESQKMYKTSFEKKINQIVKSFDKFTNIMTIYMNEEEFSKNFPQKKIKIQMYEEKIKLSSKQIVNSKQRVQKKIKNKVIKKSRLQKQKPSASPSVQPALQVLQEENSRSENSVYLSENDVFGEPDIRFLKKLEDNNDFEFLEQVSIFNMLNEINNDSK